MTKSVDTELSQHEGTRPPKTLSRTRTLLMALLGFGAADLLVLNLWAVPKLLTPGASATTTDLRAAQSGEQQPEAAGIVRPKEADPEPGLAVADPEEVAQLEEQDGHAEPDDPEVSAAQPTDDPPEPSAPPEHRYAARAQFEPPRPLQPIGEVVPGAAPPEPAETSGQADPTLLTPYAIRTAQRSVRVVLEGDDPALASSPFASLGGDDKPLMQIYFSVGNFWLGPNGKVVLERMLPQLTADERPILIIGVADPSGPEQVNDKLSDARAQSVAEWMLAHGVNAGRIQTRAIGHAGAVGNALDRRVDIWLGGSR